MTKTLLHSLCLVPCVILWSALALAESPSVDVPDDTIWEPEDVADTQPGDTAEEVLSPDTAVADVSADLPPEDVAADTEAPDAIPTDVAADAPEPADVPEPDVTADVALADVAADAAAADGVLQGDTVSTTPPQPEAGSDGGCTTAPVPVGRGATWALAIAVASVLLWRRRTA